MAHKSPYGSGSATTGVTSGLYAVSALLRLAGMVRRDQSCGIRPQSSKRCRRVDRGCSAFLDHSSWPSRPSTAPA